jgi:hypothetical protein
MEMLHGKSKGTVLWQELAEFPETVQSAGNSLAFSCGGSLPAPFDCAGQIKKTMQTYTNNIKQSNYKT